jgi:inner membrane protein
MDPLTQGLVGATAALSISNRKQHIKIASLLGLLGGMAPDLDVFFRSENDPLLFLEFHRHFTHSLFFIPIAGLLLAILLYGLVKKQCSFKETYIYVTIGYATHGLLDACTTYGTQLLWPFSTERIAWNLISVIDPIFTLPILFLVLMVLFKSQQHIIYMAGVWVLAYMSIASYQQYRVESAAWELVQQRDHAPVSIEAKPSFGNIIVWKIIYELEDHFYVDAIRAGTEIQVIAGESIQTLNIERDLPWLDMQTQQARDIERFRWFSNGYIAEDPHKPNQIIDIRYSMLPHQATGLWGIQLSPIADSDQHVSYDMFRSNDTQTLQLFWSMLMGDFNSK